MTNKMIADQTTCGGTIIHNGTYFRNPNAPGVYNEAKACSVTIQRFRHDICQLRLDFLIFDLARPRDGVCDSDRFVVNGHSQNSIIPALCGYNTGQHSKFELIKHYSCYYIYIYQVYVELGSSLGPVTLNVLSMGGKSRSFDIRVTQIHCASQYKGKAKYDFNEKLRYLLKNMI